MYRVMKRSMMISTFAILCSLLFGVFIANAKESAVDVTAPKGKISIGKEYTWTFFDDGVAYDFELFRDVTFQFTAEDTESGVSKIAYYKSDEPLTLERAQALSEDAWTEGNQLKVKVKDEEQFYLYVRFTDHAGNTSIVNTSGIVMHLLEESEDTEKPKAPTTGQSFVIYYILLALMMCLTTMCIARKKR